MEIIFGVLPILGVAAGWLGAKWRAPRRDAEVVAAAAELAAALDAAAADRKLTATELRRIAAAARKLQRLLEAA